MSKTKMLKKKNICNTNVNKIMQINNIFLTNMLMFYNKKNENKSLKLLHFERLKNIRSLLTFLFLNAYFNI